MKKLIVLAGLVALCILPAAAQTSNMDSTAHDLRTGIGGQTTQICVYCHTPHQAESPTKITQDPLWNHTISGTAAYGVYSSVTTNASITDLGGAAVNSANVSQLCLSCHDGTVAVGSLYKQPRDGTVNTTDNPAIAATDTGYTGTDLTNDHPVNFTYDSALATADGGLVTPVSTSYVDAGSLVPLFAGTVQCASCHDPHDDTLTPFLVKTIDGSSLCVTCHSK